MDRIIAIKMESKDVCGGSLASPGTYAEALKLKMSSEKDRFASFKYWFEKPKDVDTTKLARDGMYYQGFEDRVRCNECGKNFRNWSSRESPITHRCGKSPEKTKEDKSTQTEKYHKLSCFKLFK